MYNVVPATGDSFNPVFVVIAVVAAVALIVTLVIPMIGKKKK